MNFITYLVQSLKEAAKPDESNRSVHVKKGSLPPSAEYEFNGSKYTAGENTGNAANRATFEVYKDGLISQIEKPTVTNPTLSGLMDDLYRPGAKIGSGSTADAVRYEQATGQSVGDVFHTQKANDYSAALQK